MKKTLYLILLILLKSQYSIAQSPSWLWAKSAGGTNNDYGYDISADINGNVYVTGFFDSPTLTFGATILTNAGSSGSDIFTVKYDASGNPLWAKSAGGTGEDRGKSIATDANGNVYVTGYFESTSITFGSITFNNLGSAAVFIVKYDSSGNVLWAKSAGDNGWNEYGYGICTDTGGNVYVTGSFSSPFLTFGSTTLTGTGVCDMFTVKYDASGNVLWAKSAGGSDTDEGLSIAADVSGNVYVTGAFASSSINFGSTMLYNIDLLDIFTVKYDASGNFLWARSAGGTNSERGHCIFTDPSGNAYVTGYFLSSTITFDFDTLNNQGGSDIFIVKYAPSGNALWAKSAGGTNWDMGYGISQDSTENVYVTGYFSSSSISFGLDTLTNQGSSDIFTVKYTPSGNVLWAKSTGGTASDVGLGSATDANGNMYVTGYFKSPTISFGSTALNNGGNGDIFTAKLYSLSASITVNANVSCFGGNNGSAAAPASGGSSPYTYLWSNGQTTPDATGLMAGTYYVTITDLNNFTTVDSVSITEPILIQDSATATICGNDSILLQGSYQNTAGTYYDILTSVNGCDSIVTTMLYVNPIPEDLIIFTAVSCKGVCDGFATAVLPGGCTPQTYVWSNGVGTSTISGLCAGSYTVTATQCDGCSVIDSIEIAEPSEIVISISSTPDTGNTNGTAALNVTGGNPPYSFLWSTNDTSPQISNLTSKYYYVTAIDANGCTTEDSVFVDISIGNSEISTPNFEIQIIPNPNKGQFNLMFCLPSHDGLMKNVEIKIFNILGEIVYHSVNNKQPTLDVDLNKRGTGVFFVQIQYASGVLTKKVIVE